MAPHIAIFRNGSSMNAVTANPKVQRDTYFITKKNVVKPFRRVLINTGRWMDYVAAFPHANFIYTGKLAYCFWWDEYRGGIAAAIAEEPGEAQLISQSASEADRVLAINRDGTIHFGNAYDESYVPDYE
jgi:hypothetical protein